MSYEVIALAMFLGMMGMLLTGQRVFAAIGFVAGIAALNATQVNALTDTTSSGNIQVDSMFVNYSGNLTLQQQSMCIDAGTEDGAPAIDATGSMRDSKPDIGPFEF